MARVALHRSIRLPAETLRSCQEYGPRRPLMPRPAVGANSSGAIGVLGDGAAPERRRAAIPIGLSPQALATNWAQLLPKPSAARAFAQWQSSCYLAALRR